MSASVSAVNLAVFSATTQGVSRGSSVGWFIIHRVNSGTSYLHYVPNDLMVLCRVLVGFMYHKKRLIAIIFSLCYCIFKKIIVLLQRQK